MPKSATNLEYLRHIIQLTKDQDMSPTKKGLSISLREPLHTHTRKRGGCLKKKKSAQGTYCTMWRGGVCKNSNTMMMNCLSCLLAVPNTHHKRCKGGALKLL